MKKIFLLISVILVFTLNGLSVMVANNIKEVFPDEQKDEIENNLISGSYYFLLSNSNLNILLAEYEKSANGTFDFEAANKAIEDAENALTKALIFYRQATTLAKSTCYDEFKQTKLREFNFNTVVEDRKLIPSIANEVITFLSEGDVIGIYERHMSNVKKIQSDISLVKETVKAGLKPNPKVMHDLLHGFTYAVIFGNYSTVLGEDALK